jgi:hypothetical protein
VAQAYPYRYHIALDGAGLNGLEGLAGVCAFHFEPADGSYAYKVRYFDGAAAGHAVSLNPCATVGFLGNAAQHLCSTTPPPWRRSSASPPCASKRSTPRCRARPTWSG